MHHMYSKNKNKKICKIWLKKGDPQFQTNPLPWMPCLVYLYSTQYVTCLYITCITLMERWLLPVVVICCVPQKQKVKYARLRLYTFLGVLYINTVITDKTCCTYRYVLYSFCECMRVFKTPYFQERLYTISHIHDAVRPNIYVTYTPFLFIT